MWQAGEHNYLYFDLVLQDSLTSRVERSGFGGLDDATLHLFTIYGLPSQPESLTLNGTNVTNEDVTWHGDTKVGAYIHITCLTCPKSWHV